MQGSDLKRVSGLWLKDGKKGKFMSGETEGEIPAGTRLLVFKNTKKVEGDKQPDYQLYTVADDADQAPRNGRGRNGQSQGQERQPVTAPSRSAPPPPTQDEIPF